ncbi:hypothetical protein ES705_20605 [subsurface metagenome]
MTYKILSRFLIVSFAILINFCSAYYQEYEPQLINSNLRLAALGNLDLVVEELANEINAYDFGASPAGLIVDDNGKSMIYIPGIYGVTASRVTPSYIAWHGSGVSLMGVFKFRKKFAIGGSFTKTGSVEKHHDFYEPSEFLRDNIRDTLVSCWSVLPRLSIGFRGVYNKITDEYNNSWGSYFNKTEIYSYEPSLLLCSASRNWQFGLNYRFKKYDYENGDTVTHDFTVPVLYSSSNLQFGLKGKLGIIPDDDFKKILEIRSIYRISFKDRYVNLGLLLKYISPNIVEQYSYSYIPGRQIDMGFGIACVDENIGLLGIQYKKNIMTITELSNSYSRHNNYLSIGAEFYLAGKLPLRLGYTNVSSDYVYGFVSYYDVITSGFGINFPEVNIAIDFAYNLKIFKWGYYVETECDHIFGLSGRFVF